MARCRWLRVKLMSLGAVSLGCRGRGLACRALLPVGLLIAQEHPDISEDERDRAQGPSFTVDDGSCHVRQTRDHEDARNREKYFCIGIH